MKDKLPIFLLLLCGVLIIVLLTHNKKSEKYWHGRRWWNRPGWAWRRGVVPMYELAPPQDLLPIIKRDRPPLTIERKPEFVFVKVNDS